MMSSKILAVIAATLLATVMSGCSPSGSGSDQSPRSGDTSAPGSPTSSRSAGLYESGSGTVEAVGVLARYTLEGGFWAVTKGGAGDDDTSRIVAVIANGTDFQPELTSLEGRNVVATGTRFEGASVRMAGPEIMITSVAEAPASTK